MKKLFSVLLVAVLFLAISNYTFAQNVNVSSTVPVTSINYATLKLATQAINNGTHGSLAGGGNSITVQINGNITEAAPDTLRSITGTPVTIYPTTADTIFASFTTASAILTLDNASNVIIDGRINGSGAQALTARFVGTTAGSRFFRLINGSSSNTIRYVNCMGLGTGGNAGIEVGASTAATGNNNNTIESNTIKRVGRGIMDFPTAGNPNRNNIYKNNKIRNAFGYGIWAYVASENVTITGNEIYNDSVFTIGFTTGDYVPIACYSTGNSTVSNNYIHDVTKSAYAAGYGLLGIFVIPVAPSTQASTTVDVINNMVALPQSSALTTDYVIGIASNEATGASLQVYTINAYNNSVYLGGDVLGFPGDASWGIDIEAGYSLTAGFAANVYNNIAINKRFNSGAGSLEIGYFLGHYAASTLNSDYNFALATDPLNGYSGGTNGFVYQSIAALKDTACSNVPPVEQHSMFKDVNFVSTSDLHILGPVGGDMNGKPLGAVTTDIDGAARNALYPYRGCDESTALRVLTVSGCLEEKTLDGEATVGLFDACGNKSTSTGYFDVNTNTMIVTYGDSITSVPSYYLRVTSMNHLETWSASTITFGPNSAYNFITSGAYGGSISAGGCMLAGDVNQDSIIDSGDLLAIYNDVPFVITGCRLQNDANSDEIVDSGDLLVTYNNIPSVWTVQSPCPEPNNVQTNNLPVEYSKVKLTTSKKNINNLQESVSNNSSQRTK